MTCVVVATDGTTVALASDSAGSGTVELGLRADTAVFTFSPYGIGFTRSCRLGQILRYCTDFPCLSAADGDDLGGFDFEEYLDGFIVTQFVPELRRALAAHGFPDTEGDRFCVGLYGRIFEIGVDYQVRRPLQPYTAIGDGARFALGALHALHAQEQQPLPSVAVLAALEAAESLSNTVRRPFHLIEAPARGEGR